MILPVRFGASAEAELIDAARWYEEVRERIKMRGRSAVLDQWWFGSQETTRVMFFENDGLAVEISSHGIADDDLYRIIEGLQLVAVGGPNG